MTTASDLTSLLILTAKMATRVPSDLLGDALQDFERLEKSVRRWASVEGPLAEARRRDQRDELAAMAANFALTGSTPAHEAALLWLDEHHPRVTKQARQTHAEAEAARATRGPWDATEDYLESVMDREETLLRNRLEATRRRMEDAGVSP